MRVTLVLLLLRIFSKLASRLSLLIDPSSIQTRGKPLARHCFSPKTAATIDALTPRMLNTFSIQERLDQIQHTSELTENNRLLLVVSLVDFP
jgi:hypothetical protein